jgi:hypothetical protein
MHAHAATGVPECRPASVHATIGRAGTAVHVNVVEILLRNDSTAACRLGGYPALAAVAGQRVRTIRAAHDDGTFWGRRVGDGAVTVAPGAEAQVGLVIAGDPGGTCPLRQQLRLTLAGGDWTVPLTTTPCQSLRIGPVELAPAAGQSAGSP